MEKEHEPSNVTTNFEMNVPCLLETSDRYELKSILLLGIESTRVS